VSPGLMPPLHHHQVQMLEFNKLANFKATQDFMSSIGMCLVAKDRVYSRFVSPDLSLLALQSFSGRQNGQAGSKARKS